MLKHLDEAFQLLDYDSYEAITCAPGSEITKIPQMTKLTKNSDLFVINTGINNLLNSYTVSNCLHLYSKVYQSLCQSHPTTEIAFTSISYVSDNRFDGTDRSAEINPMVSELNDALKTYCSEHEMTSFVDLRPYLKGKNDLLIDRKNLSSDGLHYSRKGTEIIAKALVYETDKLLAQISNKHTKEPLYVDAISKESWPELPEPCMKPNVRPAAYPGEQFRTVVVTSRSKTSQRLANDRLTRDKQEMNHSEQSQKKTKRVDAKRSSEAVTCTMRSKKPFDNPVKQNRYIRNRPIDRNAQNFQVPISNRYNSLDVEEIPCQKTEPHTTLKFPIITKKSKTKRKTLRMYRKRKMTKLECAARGCLHLNSVESIEHLKHEYYYENPYRNSPFETLKWTKVGFIQTAAYDLLCTFAVQISHGKTGIKQHCTKDYERKIARKSEKHLCQILLLSGDIETNPGPRIKKKSAETIKKEKKLKRLQETDDKRAMRLEKGKALMANIRGEEGVEKKQSRLSADAQQKAKVRSGESPQKKKTRLNKDAQQKSKVRSTESHKNRQQRLNKDAQQKAKVRSNESPQKRQQRLSSVSQHMSKLRSEESPQKKRQRLSTNSQHMTNFRSEESPQQKRQRLSTVSQHMSKLRSEESPQKKQTRLMAATERMQNLRHQRKSVVNPPHEIINVFLSKVRRAADFVCCCCNRLMYESGVVLFNDKKYKQDLMKKISRFRMASVDNKEWICRNCHLNLMKNKMPAQAKCNGLSLCKIPEELKHLNPLEVRLISRRIPFMKLVSLPRGKQLGIQGPAVNVPTDLDTVCEQFPRLPNECQIISLKLKRKLEYRKAYIFDYVHPEKVITALHWLKSNNPLYKDININSNWVQDSEECDPELWHAMTTTTDDPQIANDNESFASDCGVLESTDNMRDGNSNNGVVQSDNPNAIAIANALQRLETRACEKGYTIYNVPADSECLFHAMCHELRKLGLYDGNARDLRSSVAQFMRDNPKCDDYEYKHFWTGRIENHDPLNADTERPTDEDRAIEAIENVEQKIEMRWLLYLRRLEHENQWGDHLVLKGLAEQFHVNIHIISSETPYTIIQTPCSTNYIGDVHLGLILQYHYVALDNNKGVLLSTAHENHNETRFTSEINEHERMVCSNNESQEPTNDEQYEAEEKAALQKSAELCGLPYESGLFNKDPDWCNKIFSCAPGENQKPIPLLSDPHFEQLSNPEKFPDGQNGLLSDREKPIFTRRYFNQRLLDVDGRFAKSTDYLLSAQYATESQQIHGNINHYVLRRAKARSAEGKKITAKDVKDAHNLHQLVRSDQAYKLLKNVRGSPAYWQSLFYDILAMMSQLGTPTWFFTLSAADMMWPDMIQTLARQSGVSLTDDDVKNLSYEDRCSWLRSNPVTAVRHFHYRLETFVKHVIMSNAKPLGEVVDYAIRIEFQARGSPHAHTLLWVKNAPQINVQTDDEVCRFVQDHISCEIPEEDNEKELIMKLQKHSHSSYCRKKGSCRFKYPKPPSERVIIAKEPETNDSTELQLKAKNIMTKMFKAIAETENLDTYSTQELIAAIGVSVDDYYKALSTTLRGRRIILTRKPSENCINPYNRTCILAWQANMDIQFVEDPHACIMYIAAYISKDEKGMGELLKQVSKECRDMEIRTKLKKLGAVFLNNREVSSQEAAMRILSIPMKKISRTVTFINTDPLCNRTAILKPKAALEAMDDDDEDIFQSNIILRYAVRPKKIENMCLASFAANYSVSSRQTNDNECDHVTNVLDDDDQEVPDSEDMPKKIILRDGSGTMTRRRREAVIRFRKFNVEKEREDFCRAKLMLFLPWRNEQTDLLKDYPDYSAHYRAVVDDLMEQESKFTINLASTYSAMEHMQQYGPPEHVWDNIAPENQHNEMSDLAEGMELERPMAEDDLVANEAMIMAPSDRQKREIVARYSVETEKTTMTPAEYRSIMRGLNKKQRQIIMYNRRWCKNAVKAWKNNQEISPYRIFLSGPGGVGKSHIIKIIQSDMRKLLRLSNRIKPTDVTVLVTAPTGVAAFNVDGMTIHSALLMKVTRKRSGESPLTFEKLNTLRSKLEHLTLLIIDEISMVGSDMFLDIHRRLNEIKGICGDGVWFGNVCILACGDLYQLPPVLQQSIFTPVKDAMAKMCGSGSIFMDEFFLHELNEIMRQKDDLAFAEMLGRIRTGNWNDSDIAKLKSREINITDPSYPKDALHAFAFNKDVLEYNMKKLNELTTERVEIAATDDKYDSTGAIDMSKLPPSKSRTETGGLETTLHLAIGARVMMTVNVDTSDGLVNGVMGKVMAFKKNEKGRVHTILVKFDDGKVGKTAKTTGRCRQEYPNCVPVERHKGQYQKLGNKGAQITRMQFPLTLSWAVTIHKCQGLTLHNIVVDMKGKFNRGQAYVAFSRVKCLQGLYITNFNQSAIKTDSAVTDVMDELRTKQLPVIQNSELCTINRSAAITVGHLNIHYFLEKQKDLINEFNVLNNIDIMCFTETYLEKSHDIKKYLDKFSYTAYRMNKENVPNRYGVMVCISKNIESQIVNIRGLRQSEICAAFVKLPKRNLVICTLYMRPSLSLKTKLEEMNLLISQLPGNSECVLIGDFNHDLSADDNKNFVKEIEKMGFYQYVTQPTTDFGSILDHVYYNGKKNITTDVLDTYFSDHDCVIAAIELWSTHTDIISWHSNSSSYQCLIFYGKITQPYF